MRVCPKLWNVFNKSIVLISLLLVGCTDSNEEGETSPDTISEATNSDVLTIIAEEFVPFEYEEDGEVKGINVEVTKVIMDRLDIPYEIKIIPWARTWKLLQVGEADATFSTSYEEFRDEYLYYTEEQKQFKITGEKPKDYLWINEFVFFIRKIHKDSLKFESYEQVKNDNYKVGIIKDNSYVDSFWDADLDTHEYPSAKDNFKALDNGEIDVYIVDKITGLATIEQLGIEDKITYIPKIVDIKPMLMPFSKRSDFPNVERVMLDYYSELTKMRDSGEYQTIYNKYVTG